MKKATTLGLALTYVSAASSRTFNVINGCSFPIYSEVFDWSTNVLNMAFLQPGKETNVISQEPNILFCATQNLQKAQLALQTNNLQCDDQTAIHVAMFYDENSKSDFYGVAPALSDNVLIGAEMAPVNSNCRTLFCVSNPSSGQADHSNYVDSADCYNPPSEYTITYCPTSSNSHINM